jgi:hypothetical protein
MCGEGSEAETIRRLFEVSVAREGLNKRSMALSTAAFHNPAGQQLELL